MPQTRYYYRLRVRNDADTGNVIVLSSKPGDANALLCEAPEGDGQSIDPLMGTLEVGAYTWQAADRYDGGDTYAITALLADADARNQILSNKCVGEYSTDGETWDVLHAGYLNDIKLSDAATYTFIVGDTDRRERDAVLFKTITEQFDKVSNFIGGPVEADTPVAWNGTPARAWGPIIDYGPARMVVISNPSGLVDPTNRITLSLTGANLPPRYLGQQGVWTGKIPNPAEYIDQLAYPYFEWDAEKKYATNDSQRSQPWGSFPQLEVKLKAVSGGAVTRSFPIAQATTKASAIGGIWAGIDLDAAVGDASALVANSNDWLIVAWDTATMGAQPGNGTAFDVWVRPLVISETNPLHLRGHPIDLHVKANLDQGIAYDAASAAATKTALGDLFYELRITEAWEYPKFVEMLKGSAGYGTRYNAAGAQEFFATRTAAPDEVATVTSDDLIGDAQGQPAEVIFRVSEASAVKGVDFTLQRFRLWNANIDSASDRPADGVVAAKVTVTGTRRDAAVFGSKIVTFDVPGMILLAGGAQVINQPFALRAWIIQAGDVIIDRAGWGWIEYEYEVLATVAGAVGDYHDLEAPHQVNAKVGQSPITQRGGTRKVQIVARTELPGTSKIKARDAGNLAQDPPEAPDDGGTPVSPCFGLPSPELSLAPSEASPFTVATVTLGNVADFTEIGADVELQYLVQTATPASTDAGATFGPLVSSAGDDMIDTPAVLAGETIWVRGRPSIAATGQICDWTDWISITLGPDDDGTGGTLPPFLLALSIDSGGVLSAAANSTVAEITKVSFLAGAAGGAAPLYADVLAGSVDASGPPFTAASLATMAEGEVRTVGAIGEDSLGNRTTLITASITRAVNTGNAEGTPGNLSLTLLAGAPAVCRGVDAALREYKSLKRARKYWNTASVLKARLQPNVWEAASAGSELHWVYSLTGGAPFAESGVFVRADRVNFPEPGAYLPLDAGAIGPNVLFSLATKNGDGTMTLKVSDVFIDTVSAEPPDSPTGDTGGLPSGGPLGNIIFYADLLRQEGYSDTDPITSLTDYSVNANDAAPYTTGAVQSAPTYKATGFPGGKPSMHVAGGVQGVAIDPPTTGHCTMYFGVGNVSGQGSDGGDAGNPNAPIAISGGDSGSNFWVSVRADGKVQAAVNTAVGAGTADVGTSAINDAAAHVVVLSWDRSENVYTVEVDGSDTFGVADAIISNFWGAVVRWYFGNVSGEADKLTADIGFILVYDRPHDATQRTTVRAALAADWGTP